MIDEYKNYGNVFTSYHDRLKLRIDEIERMKKNYPSDKLLHEKLNYEKNALEIEIKNIDNKRNNLNKDEKRILGKRNL